jgi:phosphoglycerol transferase
MATNVSDQPHARPERGDRATAPALRARLSAPWVREVAWLSGTMIVAFFAAAWVLQLWDASLHIPIVSTGDALLNMSVIKGIIQHGWYFTNSSVGAPLGQEQYDYSAFDGDNLPFLAIRVLALGISDPAALLNVWYMLGYPLVAGASYLAMRGLGISRPAAAATGVVFALLPYHFARGEGHLFLGDYIAVPAGGFLVLMTLTGRSLLRPRDGVSGWRRWLTPAAAAAAACCLVAGASTLYYAVFTILLLGMTAILRALAQRTWRAGVPGMAAAVAVGCVLVVNLSPALVYQHQHGKDPAAAQRQPVESELFSLSLTQLMLPIQGHRIRAFAELYQKHQSTTPIISEGGMQMGILASLSLIGLLILLASRALRGPPAGVLASSRAALAGAAAIAAALAFLIGTFGGISSLIAYIVSPQIRGWNRLTPYIGFFALIGLALFLDYARGWIVARGGVRVGRPLALAFVALVAVIGVLDQTAKTFAPQYTATAAAWRNDGRFVSVLEHSVPKGSMIYQLPYHPFPETSGTFGMADYDLFKGYVHSQNLRWSYGAMKGRVQDWGDEASQQPIAWQVQAATAAGFAGVYIDRAAYADHGQAVERAVRKALGGGPAVNGDDAGRLVFYSSAALAARQHQTMSDAQRAALADALIHPISVSYPAGFFDPETPPDGSAPYRWMTTYATMGLDNTEDHPRREVFEVTAAAGVGRWTITMPGGAKKVVRFRRGEEHVAIPFTAPRGKSTINFFAETPKQGDTDPRDLRIQAFNPRVVSAP